jgi:hypothetical protein
VWVPLLELAIIAVVVAVSMRRPRQTASFFADP